MRKLLLTGRHYWAWSIYWDGNPFRVLYLGFWCLCIDRTGRWFERWPHISLNWNDDVHN